jgi:transglutaminase-like putative cysteine protease
VEYNMRRLITTVITFSVLAVPAAAGEKLAGKVVLEHWDAAYLQGARAGYVHTFTEEFERDGKKLLRTTIELRLKVRRYSDTIEMAMDAGDVANADGKVVGVFMRQFLGKDKKLEITGLVEGDQLRLTRDGATELKPAPWNDEVVGLYKQQSLFKDRKVTAGDQFTYLSFEPTVNLVLRTQVDVKGNELVELPGSKQKVPLLRVESVPQRLEKVQLPPLIAWLDANRLPVISETEVPGLGPLRLVRTTKAGALATGSIAQVDIGLSQLVRLRQPIQRPYETSSAVYRIEVRDDADPASAFAQDGRQRAANVKSGTFELHVNADAKAPPAVGDDKGPGVEFTESSYFITSADKQVRRHAAEAVGVETDPWRKALRIERWVHNHMKGTNDQALAPADHVAKTLQGDCTEYAMLTAAMCRAEGIASRTAVGLIYADVRGQPAFAFHMWTEVWIKGAWLPIDATLGLGRVGATHLKISDQSWHEVRDMTPLFPVVRVLGRVRIEVVSVQ